MKTMSFLKVVVFHLCWKHCRDLFGIVNSLCFCNLIVGSSTFTPYLFICLLWYVWTHYCDGHTNVLDTYSDMMDTGHVKSSCANLATFISRTIKDGENIFIFCLKDLSECNQIKRNPLKLNKKKYKMLTPSI